MAIKAASNNCTKDYYRQNYDKLHELLLLEHNGNEEECRMELMARELQGNGEKERNF